MPAQQTAAQTLDREFLDIRHRLIDIAAALDRIDRGENSEIVKSDSRLSRILDAAGIIGCDQPNRAERVQLLFSDSYDANWRRMSE